MAIKREANLMPDARRSSRSVDTHTRSSVEALESSAGVFGRLQVVSSILLRIGAYIYLRWIPNSGLMRWMHPLYALYVVAWVVRQASISSALHAILESAQLATAASDLNTMAEGAKAKAKNKHNISLNNTSVEHQAENGRVESEKDAVVKALSPFELAKTLVFGRSTRSTTINLLNFAFHTILFLFFVDAVWSPYLFPSHHEHTLHFAHIGAIGPKSAVVHVRYPFPLGDPNDFFDGALIEQDMDGGSSGGALKDLQALLNDPQPLRIVYREVRSVIPSGTAVLGSIDGRMRTASKRWERGPLLTVVAETDWTASAKIEGLWPATEYEWRLAFTHNSTFTPTPAQSRRFVTWPDPRLSEDKSTLGILHAGQGEVVDNPAPFDDPNHFTFGSSSCIKPDFPWAPTQFWAWSWVLRLFNIGNGPGGLAVRNRIPGFDILAKSVLDGRERPAMRFFLQLGDVIYGDVPYWGGPFTNTYRKLYRNLFASDSFRRVYERLPIMGIYDDHEVTNNWGGNKLVSTSANEDEGGRLLTQVREPESMRPAVQAWQEYIGSSNPEPLVAGENYYTFRYGDTAFFVMDTRKHRSPFQIEDDEDKTMLGHTQRDAFARWLGAVNATATFKFVVSSVPFNTLWGGPLDWDGKTDSWAAYRSEREYLMSIMQYVPNLIVLSGDRHEFAAVGLTTRGTQREAYHPVTEFSTSPLSMFYVPVRTLSQEHGLGPTGAERLYKYLPDGNVKWSEFEVDTRDVSKPMVHVKVLIDGHLAWRVTVHGSPIHRTRNAIGGIAKSFLELLNWRPRRWF